MLGGSIKRGCRGRSNGIRLPPSIKLGPKRTDVSKESAVQVKAAIYARFSTEKQSEASIEDQFRVCERIAEREGFNVVARFSDAAISGGTSARIGYQSLLKAARRR